MFGGNLNPIFTFCFILIPIFTILSLNMEIQDLQQEVSSLKRDIQTLKTKNYINTNCEY